MNRQLETHARRCVAILALTVVAGCGGAASATSEPAAATAPAASAPGAASPSAPAAMETASPAPDPRALPLVEVPSGYRAGERVRMAPTFRAGDAFVGLDMDHGTVSRWDAATFELLGKRAVGDGGFPPDAQSGSLGSEGVWVNLAAQNAVMLMDPRTGKELRRVEILGHPYDMIEVDGELWIADFGWSEVTRYDLRTDKVVAVIPVSAPTDILFAADSIWLPVHLGRAAEAEPLDGPAGQLVRIDPSTNAVVERIKVGHRPYYLAFGFGAVWTGNATSASVSRVDVDQDVAVTIPVGEDGAFDIEVIGDSVWAATGPQWPPERTCDPATAFFVRIDPATDAVRERIAFPCAGGIVPDGEAFWVGGSDADGPFAVRYEPVG
jgi:hypothetical protein